MDNSILSITQPANTGIDPAQETFQVQVTCPVEETEEGEGETEGEPAESTPAPTQPPEIACEFGYVFDFYSIICDNVNFVRLVYHLKVELRIVSYLCVG